MSDRRNDPGDSSSAAGSRGAKIFSGARGLGRREARAYQGVLEAVLCVPAGALLGYGVDRWLQAAPWGVLAGLGLGFVAFVLAAMRLPGRLAPPPDASGAGPAERNGK